MKQKQNELLSILYERYYQSNDFSKQTSSFWRKYGEFQNVTKSGTNYKLKGLMFGEYKRNSVFNSIKNIRVSFFVSNLLKNCDKDIIEATKFIAKKSSRLFSYDLARMALTINLLRQKISNLEKRKFCIIGDGYGALGCLIKKLLPNSKIISINLGKTLFFDAYYSQMIFPNAEHTLFIKNNNNSLSKDFTYIEAENFDHVDADIFINIASMQEMNNEDINLYFHTIRNQDSETWFYCCNRISKELPDGKVINFDEYPWIEEDKIILDELCPWYQEYPTNRPPFVLKFPPVNHRLVKVGLKK